MLKKTSGFLSLIVVMVLLCAIPAYAAPADAPAPEYIIVTNNVTGAPDTVAVSNLLENDIVKVYGSSAGKTPLGVSVVAAGGSSTVVYINQLGTATGNVYVTVTSGDLTESARTAKAYDGEEKSDTVSSGNITAVNNLTGTPDTVTVTGLSDGDIVRAYSNMTTATPLATAVSSGGTAVIYVDQLGAAAGNVYVTVQSDDKLESARTAAGYVTEVTTVLPAGSIVVTNNFYKETAGVQDADSYDTVTVSGVAAGDTVKVYKASAGTVTWAVLDIPDDFTGDEATLQISQLGKSYGKVYVTVTKPGKAESKRTAVSYLAEPVTPPLKATSVTVSNLFNDDDTVTVAGLADGSIIKVYSSATSTEIMGSATAADGSAAVTLADGKLSSAGGKIYVTVTSSDANESTRTAVSYAKETTTPAPLAKNVTVANNFGEDDTVTVTGLTADTVVKVYSSSGASLGQETAAGTSATITVAAGELSPTGGKLYVTLKLSEANESAKTAVSYGKEPATPVLSKGDVSVTNNYGSSDTVLVSNITSGIHVKLYSSLKGTELIDEGTSTGTSIEFTLPDGKLSAAGGTIYVTVSSATANESARTAVAYTRESVTSAPLGTNVTVVNNYNTTDSVTVTGLTIGDTVKIYTSLKGTVAIGAFTADDDDEDETESIDLAPGLLNSGGGKIYVTVKSLTANESARTSVTYTSEKSTAPVAGNVDVTNNFYSETGGVQDAGTEDIIMVTGVELGDIIRIYKAASGADMWTADPVAVTSVNLIDGAVTVEVGQLGTKAGKLYVSITKANKTESPRAAVSYSSEPTTTALSPSSIIVANNFGDVDTITINNLTDGQMVSIYTTPNGVVPLDSAEAEGSSLTFTLENGLLTAGGGKVFVTVRDTDKLESKKTQQTYTSEQSVSPKLSNILVVNLPGTSNDVVTLVGLTAGDTVTIYSAATGGTILAQETVGGKATILTLATNLPNEAGKIWVTITGDGKAESKRVAVSYHEA